MTINRPKLLVVDDQANNIHALTRIIDDVDIEIIAAYSGMEALKAVLKHDFFLVLMDVQMPEMNGFETVELMQSNKKTSHIPIIFLTAISKSDEFVIQGYGTGAVDYMYKPVDPFILLGKIRVFKELWNFKEELVLKNQQLEEKELQLQHMANYDGLTQIANRNLYHASLHKAMLRQKRSIGMLAVLFIDLDSFKQVNDGAGHDAGDQLLVQVAQRISTSIREGDLAARMGGDEFAVILYDIESTDNAIKVAAKILSQLKTPFELDHTTANISGSIGISFYTGESEPDHNELIKKADTAMYDAKHSGKNQYCLADA